jgi:hypothetical protein
MIFIELVFPNRLTLNLEVGIIGFFKFRVGFLKLVPVDFYIALLVLHEE